MTHEEAIAFLNSRLNYESRGMPDQAELRVDRTALLLEHLGRPQDHYRIIHVAGTKGKGSTATMIANLLTDAGLQVGLHTSPHLHAVEERFQVNGRPISSEQFADLVEEMRPLVQEVDARIGPSQPSLTFFEITTALSLLHFHRAQVDVAVIEVGMGGRLDSTNVVDPTVCVLTTISLDHTKQLGSTLEAVAREKAGIIKAGKHVVSGVVATEAQRVIRERSSLVGARLRELRVDFDFTFQSLGLEGSLVDATTWRGAWPAMRVAPIGAHQCANVATALATMDALMDAGLSLPRDRIGHGLARLAIPGRFEVMASRPWWIVDVAHNPASFEALAATLDAVAPKSDRRRRILIFGVSRDKDWRGMCKAVQGRFDTVVLTQYTAHARALPVATLAEHFRDSGMRVLVTSNTREAWQTAMAELPVAEPVPSAPCRDIPSSDDLILASGSFYLVAELREMLRAE